MPEVFARSSIVLSARLSEDLSHLRYSSVLVPHIIDTSPRDGKQTRRVTSKHTPQRNIPSPSTLLQANLGKDICPPRLIVPESLRMRSLHILAAWKRDGSREDTSTPRFRWHLSRGIGLVEGASLTFLFRASSPPTSRLVHPTTACTRANSTFDGPRPIHIARWLFDHGLVRTTRAPWKRQTRLTFPPPPLFSFRPFNTLVPRQRPPRRGHTAIVCIYVLTYRPPSPLPSCSSSRLSVCLFVNPAVRSGDPLLIACPTTCLSLQYAPPPPLLSRPARLTCVLKAGPSRSPHRHQQLERRHARPNPRRHLPPSFQSSQRQLRSGQPTQNQETMARRTGDGAEERVARL